MSTTLGKNINTDTDKPLFHQNGFEGIYDISDTGEQSLLTPGEQALLEACTIPADKAKEWYETAEIVFNNMLEELPNQIDRLVLEPYLQYQWWLRFGKVGGELPQGMILVPTSNTAPGVHPEFTSDYLEERFDSLFNHFRSRRPSELVSIDAHFDVARPEIQGALAQVVKEHPVYGFLSMLARNHTQYTETSLTESWRRIRENQEEAKVREIHGLDSESSLRTNYDAFSSFQRAVGRIDDETMRAKVKADDPTKRVERWFISEINHPERGYQYQKNTHGKIVKIRGEMPSGNNGGLKAEHEDGTITDDLGHYLAYWGRQFTEQTFGTMSSPAQRLAKVDELAADFVYKYYMRKTLHEAFGDPIPPPATMLEDAVANVSSNHNYKNYSLLRSPQLLVELRKPKGAYVVGEDFVQRSPYRKIWTPQINRPEREYVDITSRDNFTKKKKQTIATVERTKTDSETSRLLTIVANPVELPSTVEHYDLRIVIARGDHAFRDLEQDEGLYVQGYEAVAKDGDKWYFQKVPTDPYEGAESIVFFGKNNEDLAESLRSMGLEALAEVVASQPNFSLKELARLVSENSNYSFNTQLPMLSTVPRNGILQFKELVEEGKLQVQCDGANAFLRTLICELTGNNEALSLSGYIIAGKKVSASAHNQTGYMHNGQLYIVDATPTTSTRITRRRTAGSGDINETNDSRVSAVFLVAAPLAVMSSLLDKRPQLPKRNPRPKKEKPAKKTKESTIDQLEHSATESVSKTKDFLGSAVLGEIPADAFDSAEYFAAQEAARQAQLVGDMEEILRGHFALSSRADVGEIYKQVRVLDAKTDPLRRTVEVIRRSRTDALVPLQPGELENAKQYLTTLQQTSIPQLRKLNLPVYEPGLLNVLQQLLSRVNS